MTRQTLYSSSMSHIIGHFWDDLLSQSHDCCKKLFFLTSHFAATSKNKYNYNQMTTQKT